jgi:uncharacterized membrane protein YgdD (TMEM256/DUF423 family)
MNKTIQLRGIVFAGLAVILGAFGAHALKAVLPADRLPIFETGVRYQLIHAIALIALSLVTQNTWTKRVALAMTFGIILFSGSLYLIATNSILPFTLGAWVGPITPIGGLFFITGWFCWGMATYRG